MSLSIHAGSLAVRAFPRVVVTACVQPFVAVTDPESKIQAFSAGRGEFFCTPPLHPLRNGLGAAGTRSAPGVAARQGAPIPLMATQRLPPLFFPDAGW